MRERSGLVQSWFGADAKKPPGGGLRLALCFGSRKRRAFQLKSSPDQGEGLLNPRVRQLREKDRN